MGISTERNDDMHVKSIAYLLIAGLLTGLLLVVAPRAESAQSDTSGSAQDADHDAKIVLGWVENMRLLPQRMLLKAKLDPGARSSAIHAENIEEFERDGRRMVRFTILREHDNPDSERLVLERPLVREVNIKLRTGEGEEGDGRQERLAVRLEFCLAGERYNTLFSLTNRDNFNYPVLLGRQFLRNRILVDSGESFTQRTNCR
jgi:hypothetical protein